MLASRSVTGAQRRCGHRSQPCDTAMQMRTSALNRTPPHNDNSVETSTHHSTTLCTFQQKHRTAYTATISHSHKTQQSRTVSMSTCVISGNGALLGLKVGLLQRVLVFVQEDGGASQYLLLARRGPTQVTHLTESGEETRPG
jgi:hypothetical protein